MRLVLPIWVVFQVELTQTIDSIYVGSRIAPSMYPKLALLRIRRPKPTYIEKAGLFVG